MSENKFLLSITELGGYPDFSEMYKKCGYEVDAVKSMRKALRCLKENKHNVVVAEFNFQSDFRDRTSSLETLMAVIQQMHEVKVIIFYENEYKHQFDKLRLLFTFHEELPYPINEEKLKLALC